MAIKLVVSGSFLLSAIEKLSSMVSKASVKLIALSAPWLMFIPPAPSPSLHPLVLKS